MIEINLNDSFRIEGDEKQYILKSKKIVVEGDNKGKEYWTNEGYFKSLEALFNYYIDLRVRCSDATTFKELVESVRQFKKEVREVLEI